MKTDTQWGPSWTQSMPWVTSSSSQVEEGIRLPGFPAGPSCLALSTYRPLTLRKCFLLLGQFSAVGLVFLTAFIWDLWALERDLVPLVLILRAVQGRGLGQGTFCGFGLWDNSPKNHLCNLGNGKHGPQGSTPLPCSRTLSRLLGKPIPVQHLKSWVCRLCYPENLWPGSKTAPLLPTNTHSPESATGNAIPQQRGRDSTAVRLCCYLIFSEKRWNNQEGQEFHKT